MLISLGKIVNNNAVLFTFFPIDTFATKIYSSYLIDLVDLVDEIIRAWVANESENN